MSNEMKAKIMKAAPNRWFVFCILTLSGGIAFKLSSMKDMFYVPMQQFMGLTNTQIGGALSMYGIVQTIGLIVGIFICDMFSKKYMIGGSLIGLGVVGIYLSTFPGYWGFLVCAIVMAAFLMVPHESLGQSGNWILGAACTLGFGAIVFTMRAVFFAPMDEVKVPAEITGAAMSLASLVIYLPNAFAYVMYGSFLDRHPGMEGFRIVFSVMIGWAVIGLFVSTFLIHRIKKHQKEA